VTAPGFAEGLLGITLDRRYRLDAVLGEGGMGAVFRATHVELDRKVAVKLLKPHLANDAAALERFAREARATRRVESPHAVKILDFGITPKRDYYMVLEYLDGRTVQRELEIDGPFAPTRVAHIARQALGALGTAHDQGLIHRDVKPDNLLLMRSGSDPDFTKILDFGVAKLMQGAAGAPAPLALTAAGTVFGTPEFMSPEQACGHVLDGRSDLYSLAATMFVMLTGAPLFEGGKAIELLTHQVRTPPPRLAMVRPELAGYRALDDLLQRCLAKKPDHRPSTAEEMEALIAAVEPTLRREPAGAITANPGAPRSRTSGAAPRASGYVAALRDTEIAAAAKPPGSTTAAETNPALAATRVLPAAPAQGGHRHRWFRVAAGAAAAIVICIGLGRLLGTGGPGAAPHGPVPATAATANTVGSARLVEPAARSAPANSVGEPTEPVPGNGAGSSAAGAAGVGARAPGAAAAPKPAVPRTPLETASASHAAVRLPAAPSTAAPRHDEADEHLRGAEAALRASNALRQLAEADLALRADPTSVRAKYLLGDALIKSGDLDRGCEYLRTLQRNAAARERARAAGCPGN